jgi:hypothetical protein
MLNGKPEKGDGFLIISVNIGHQHCLQTSHLP